MESNITITLDADGRLTIAATGTAQGNLVVALGMLEIAKAMMTANNAKAAEQSPLLQARKPSGLALPAGVR